MHLQKEIIKITFKQTNKFFVGILKVNEENSRIRIRIPASESGSGSICQRHGSADPDPDPHQNAMDPQHWRQDTSRFSLSFYIHDFQIFKVV